MIEAVRDVFFVYKEPIYILPKIFVAMLLFYTIAFMLKVIYLTVSKITKR